MMEFRFMRMLLPSLGKKGMKILVPSKNEERMGESSMVTARASSINKYKICGTPCHLHP
jgi:hypothetical protein